MKPTRRPSVPIAPRLGFGGVLLLLSGLGVDSRAATGDAAIAALPTVPWDYEGRLRADYDYRRQGAERDGDLYGYWSAGLRDAVNGYLDVYGSGRLHRDLDRPAALSFADDAYAGLDEAAGVTENRLLQLYVEGHDRRGRMSLRVGRQYIEIADYLHLDGGQAMLFENGSFGGRAFYGRPVSFYASVSGDSAWGVSLAGRPWPGNRTRLTYACYESSGGDDANGFADVQQEFGDAMRLRGQGSVLNRKFRMARLDGFYAAADGGTDVAFGGSRWGAFDARTRAYSPLYEILGEQAPYTYAYARMTKVLFPHWSVSPGVSCRWADGSAASYANRDYGDYDLSLSYEPNRAFSASVSLDYWDVRGGDGFLALSGDVRYRRGRLWEVSVGSSYAKYTHTEYSDLSYTVNGGQTSIAEEGTVSETTPHTLSYFARVRWNVNRNLIFRIQGDAERDSTFSEWAYRGRASIEVRL